MESKKWENMGVNVILRAKWGRISYNPDTSAHPLAGLTTQLIRLMGRDVKDGEETALYDGKIWRILTGDFRKDYEKVFPNLEKCLTFYESKKAEFRNNFSTD